MRPMSAPSTRMSCLDCSKRWVAEDRQKLQGQSVVAEDIWWKVDGWGGGVRKRCMTLFVTLVMMSCLGCSKRWVAEGLVNGRMGGCQEEMHGIVCHTCHSHTYIS